MDAQMGARRKWFERPLTELRKAADRDDAAAQAVLGECYDDGTKGLSKSPKLAAEWRAKAAAGGNAIAQCNLGWHYDRGEGVAQDFVEAVRLYLLAAIQGLPGAMHNLALCLAEGRGCDKAPVQAVLWMRRAAELGSAGTQHALADWYRQGVNSLPVNFKEAMRLARLGAEQGHPGATCLVGYLYANGLGVAANLDEACKWYRQAAELGDVAKLNLCNYARADHAPSLAVVRELGLGPL